MMQQQIIAPNNVRILQDSDLPHTDSIPDPNFGQVMYGYRQQGVLDGVPVAEDALNLLVSSEQQLRNALELRSTVHTFMEWLEPDALQKRKQYEQILQAAMQGHADIIQELKQYSQSKGAFLVFVKYRCLQYTLHPRWQHLKDNNEVHYG